MRTTTIAVLALVLSASLKSPVGARHPPSRPHFGGTGASALRNGVIEAEARQGGWTRERLQDDPDIQAGAGSTVDPEFWILLSPAELAAAPEPVRRDLEGRGCRVLQRKRFSTPHNIIWGEFERPGQRDLCVQCATAAGVTVYVYWGGEAARVERVPVVGRGLTVADPDAIRDLLDPSAPLADDMPRIIDHDGIEAAVGECCSAIFYKHQGRWYSHPGAD
jgi:hypothetical protein